MTAMKHNLQGLEPNFLKFCFAFFQKNHCVSNPSTESCIIRK
uniref:Uncharacterized protein n=1 Tax=Parascaris equorum TaxID=6256 RepID=A0A914RLN5_PAREQ